MTQLKYTKEQETELEEGYKACEDEDSRDEFIAAFAAKHGKSNRSIIAKLSKMDIYVSKIKVSKITGKKPETKEQLVKRIEDKFKIKDLEGLDKAPKLTLLKLLGER